LQLGETLEAVQDQLVGVVSLLRQRLDAFP
jgi:hypothetical protein